MGSQPPPASSLNPHSPDLHRPITNRSDTTYTQMSMMSVPPEGSILTGKQEHCPWPTAFCMPSQH
jgi:hypothetical protein